MEINIPDEKSVDWRYKEKLYHFRPMFGNHNHIEACGVIGEIREEEEELMKAKLKGRSSPTLRQSIHDKKKTVLFLLSISICPKKENARGANQT